MDINVVRVLLVEDDEDDYILTRDLLDPSEGETFQVDWVSTYDDAIQAIDECRHDVYLIDYRLGERDGLELLREAAAKGCKAPLILLTGQGDHEVDMQAMKAGAADYLIKGQVGAPLLKRVIRYAIQSARQMEALRRSEEQLRHSQKMEAVGRLAGGIAHDFNNLLTAINGYSELLLEQLKDDHPARSNAEEIHKAAQRAVALTGQLLTFSRKQALQTRVIDLNALLGEMEKMLPRMLGDDIELFVLLGEESGRIKADPGQVEQVVMNLVVNARDAMPQGGTLTIETACLELDEEPVTRQLGISNGRYVMLAVRDTGIGMDEEVRSHVFEPFYTTKDPDRGTGLGLSSVYGIVQQSGGGIRLQSEPGQGTTFEIYFPAVDEPVETVKRPSYRRRDQSPASETILLVEDQVTVRRLVRKILQMQGYTVLEAARGEEAVLTCERHEGPIHLLVTDVVMPEMSGGELAQRLAIMRPDMKVLYVSGYANRDVLPYGVPDADDNFLQKPFTVDGLTQKVRDVLNAANSAPAK